MPSKNVEFIDKFELLFKQELMIYFMIYIINQIKKLYNNYYSINIY